MLQIYANPVPEDVIASVLAHHSRRAGEQNPGPAVGAESAPQRYRQDSLDVLFGRSAR